MIELGLSTSKFNQKTVEELAFYVYALFDPSHPRLPFYIGKGSGNRVFSHAIGCEEQNTRYEPLSTKFEEIKRIIESGNAVIHKIIRYGLSEDEAFKVEAALIDLVNHIEPDTLTNEISGQGVALGIYDANDLAITLNAEKLLPAEDDALLIIKIERQWTSLLAHRNSPQSITDLQIYNVMKGDWKLNITRAARANCILAVARGLVRAAFEPSPWVMAPNSSGRKMMIGPMTVSARQKQFNGKSVAHLFKRGAAFPIRYVNC
jgi:uncharacterized protein